LLESFLLKTARIPAMAQVEQPLSSLQQEMQQAEQAERRG